MPAGRSRRVAKLFLAVGVLALSAVAAVGAAWFLLPDPAAFAKDPPRTTALIEQRKAEAKAKRRAYRPRMIWVSLDRVSPRLVDAVLASEDSGFWSHGGIDWNATREAAQADLSRGTFARGASTITQQLAKNLWYGTEKSLLRKGKEAIQAVRLERSLGKRRILALYLNVAEWGDGVFGIEAGARARFGTSAAALGTAQAVVMASMLPAPRRVDLDKPSTWLKRRSRRLLDRLLTEGRIPPAEHAQASLELERILAGPVPIDDVEEPPPAEDEPVAQAPAASPVPASAGGAAP